MDTSLKKWERWLEQSLRLDTGYPKIRVQVSAISKEDVSVQRIGDTYEVEIHALLRNQPERFKEAYGQVLREIMRRTSN